MKYLHTASLLALALGSLTTQAQSLQLTADAQKAPYLMTSKDTVEVNYAAGMASVAVISNVDDYTIAPKDDAADWLSYRKEANGNLTFFTKYYYEVEQPRTATFTLTTTDCTVSRDIVVKQTINTAAETVSDIKLTIASATASSTQNGYGIANSYDESTSTIWHSDWGGCTMPATLTYTLKEASHVDYMVYTPRTDSSYNGCFGRIKVYYALEANPTDYVLIAETDLGMTKSIATIAFGDNGVDDVKQIKIEVYTAATDAPAKNYASCAEMAFYGIDTTLRQGMNDYFADPLCTTLKPEVDEATIATIAHPYLRLLASKILQGNYSTKFRVGEFECYLNRLTLQQQLKTSNAYDMYENPTGIYFEQGDKVIVFAQNIQSQYPVKLCIANFSSEDRIAEEGQAESYYDLKNGLNIIEAANRGNAYLNYYSETPDDAPNVKVHFALARENGYFKQGVHNNDDWKQMLAGAQSDCIDVLSNRLHSVIPLKNIRMKNVTDAEKLALIYDSLIYREREIMGLPQRGIEPKNHQFARPVKSGMFADAVGAAAQFGSWDGWSNPNDFEFWGMAHELGHNNQIYPGFKWHGCGETTNNLYASWVQHKLGAKTAYGNGSHRLEDEVTGSRDYSNMRGGRFQVYIEEGVRKGISWQLQDGCDYYGSEPNMKRVTDEDENGNKLSTITTPTRNYDHFVKLAPLWQLSLWTEECGFRPGAWGNLINSYRESFNGATYNTAGKQQIEMMRRFMDINEIDLCDFFEKAGLLKPIKAYIEDYSPGWNIITQAMCNELKSYIAAKGYEKAPAGLNLINAYNVDIFRNKIQLTEGTIGAGCASPNDNKVKVDNTVWPGAVGYETYNANGDLIRITLFGLGDNAVSAKYTYVLFPSDEGASYIMAVGYDGTRVKIYQK